MTNPSTRDWSFPSPRGFWNRWAWGLLAAQWGLILGVQSAFRLAFYLRYRDVFVGASGWEVLAGFVHGLRFDASVLLAFTGPAALAFFLLSPWRMRRWPFWLLFAWMAGVALAMFVLQGMDLFYYGFVGRRISFEVYAMLNDWRPILTVAGAAYLLPTVLILALLAALLALAAVWCRRLARRPYQSVPWWSQLGQGVLLAFVMALLIRGGWQAKPLSVGMAFRGANLAVGHLTLNPVFTTVSALYRKKQRLLHYYPDADALHTTRALLGMDGPPLDPRYPLLRRNEGTPAPRPRNVVIITLESFSAQLTGALGGTEGVTPAFDRLAGEGLLFSRFYAAGTRSLEGIASILSGFPALPTGTLIGTTLEQNAVRSLPLILKERGYHAFFLHGAFKGSMWFDDFANRNGFERYIAKEDFPDDPADFDGMWGIFDHLTLERLHTELEASARPVLAFYFSLTSHTPFALPDPRFRRFGPETPNADMLNAVAYTDDSLGRFFALARGSDYWNDTIFVVTADHNMGGTHLDARGRMWIPLLILNPGDPAFPRGTVSEVLGSQVDIAQTLLELLGLPAAHTFAGNSLLRPAAERFALFGWGSQSGWLREDGLLIHDLEKPVALYRLTPGTPAGLALPAAEAPDPQGRAVVELQSYLQTLNNLLMENRLSPPSGPSLAGPGSAPTASAPAAAPAR